MRKILVVLMLVIVVNLFAKIPADTKSIGISAQIGDLLSDDDLRYTVSVQVGNFIIDNLEIIETIGINNASAAAVILDETEYTVGGGAAYHYPIGSSSMFGLFGKALFIFNSLPVDTGEEIIEGYINIPIDVGVEIFIDENFAIQVYNEFVLQLEEAFDNNNYIKTSLTLYFQ